MDIVENLGAVLQLQLPKVNNRFIKMPHVPMHTPQMQTLQIALAQFSLWGDYYARQIQAVAIAPTRRRFWSRICAYTRYNFNISMFLMNFEMSF